MPEWHPRRLRADDGGPDRILSREAVGSAQHIAIIRFGERVEDADAPDWLGQMLGVKTQSRSCGPRPPVCRRSAAPGRDARSCRSKPGRSRSSGGERPPRPAWEEPLHPATDCRDATQHLVTQDHRRTGCATAGESSLIGPADPNEADGDRHLISARKSVGTLLDADVARADQHSSSHGTGTQPIPSTRRRTFHG